MDIFRTKRNKVLISLFSAITHIQGGKFPVNMSMGDRKKETKQARMSTNVANITELLTFDPMHSSCYLLTRLSQAPPLGGYHQLSANQNRLCTDILE